MSGPQVGVNAMAGINRIAPQLSGPALFDQDWLSVFFLHWAVDPVDVASLFPRGTRPDEFNGATYVGLVPFRMVRAGVGRGLPTPYLGTFLECNVRLYSVDDQGRHGVVFLSLEASRWVTGMSARWGYRLPDTWARMHVRQRGSGSSPTVRAAPPSRAAARVRRPAAPRRPARALAHRDAACPHPPAPPRALPHSPSRLLPPS